MVLSGLCDLVSFGVGVEIAVDIGAGAGLLIALGFAHVVQADTGSGIWLDVHRVAQLDRILLAAVLEFAPRRLSFGLCAPPQTLP